MSVQKQMCAVGIGPVQVAVFYHDQDGKRVPELRAPGQGIRLEVRAPGSDDGDAQALLQFDLLDDRPCYRYAPGELDDEVLIDTVACGNALTWSCGQLRTSLAPMVERAGRADLAAELAKLNIGEQFGAELDEVEATARGAAQQWRRTVTHNGSKELVEIPDAKVIQAGNIRFGLEFRNLPGLGAKGVAIHVLSDVAGQEIELLAFDCFDKNAHYHYGPRNRDYRHYWDTTVVPDPLRWTLDRLAEGRLGEMIARAGYPDIAANLDTALIARLLESELEPAALALQEAYDEAA